MHEQLLDFDACEYVNIDIALCREFLGFFRLVFYIGMYPYF